MNKWQAAVLHCFEGISTSKCPIFSVENSDLNIKQIYIHLKNTVVQENDFYSWEIKIPSLNEIGVTYTNCTEISSNVDMALYLNLLTLKCTAWVRTTGAFPSQPVSQKPLLTAKQFCPG